MTPEGGFYMEIMCPICSRDLFKQFYKDGPNKAHFEFYALDTTEGTVYLCPKCYNSKARELYTLKEKVRDHNGRGTDEWLIKGCQ